MGGWNNCIEQDLNAHTHYSYQIRLIPLGISSTVEGRILQFVMTDSYISQIRFAERLSQGFSHIHTQLAIEEHRLLDLSQNYKHKVYQGTPCKRARMEQLVDVRDSINLHLVSPALVGLKDGLLKEVSRIDSRSDEFEDEQVTAADIEKISGEQSAKLMNEVKKSHEKIYKEIGDVFCGGHPCSIEKFAEDFFKEIKFSIERDFKIRTTDHHSESSCDNQTFHFKPKKRYTAPPRPPKPEEPPEETDWEAPDYKILKIPEKSFKNRENSSDLKGVAVGKKNCFVADKTNHLIQVLSLDFEQVTFIKNEQMESPYGIAVSNEYVYVTDTESHSVLCFLNDSFELHKKVGQKGANKKSFSSPKGLCVDIHSEEDVYIADSNNHRVLVYSKDLEFRHKIELEGEKDSGLKNPQDVAVTQKMVVVLDWGGSCVKFFIKGGGDNCHIRSCVNQARDKDVAKPSFFCVDPLKNLIISDFLNHRIVIFNKNGKRIHKFGESGEEKGQMAHPTGVAMTEDKRIIVISENENYGLQVF